VTSFDEDVYNLARRIPPGRVTSYGAIARALGAPRKARQVGWALHRCPDDVPAHRVVNSVGKVTGDPVVDGAELRRLLLVDEGVELDSAGRCDLRRYFWDPVVL
jgi:methylated-DNA-protein-cysteine methyltransferase-like protein